MDLKLNGRNRIQFEDEADILSDDLAKVNPHLLSTLGSKENLDTARKKVDFYQTVLDKEGDLNLRQTKEPQSLNISEDVQSVMIMESKARDINEDECCDQQKPVV